MVVVKNDDSAFLLIGASTFQNELEVHFYSSSTVTGIARTPNYPVPLNKDWKQFYNIPTHTDGTAGAYTNEGMYCTYNKTRNGEYSFQYGYIVPDRGTNKYLGKQITFATNDKHHHLYISTNDVNSPGNAGRVYFINHGVDSTGNAFTFALAKNKNYKGPFSNSQIYYENDIGRFFND